MPKRKARQAAVDDENAEDVGKDKADAPSSSATSDSCPEVSSEQEEEDDEDSDFSQINVDFDFFDPKESDFHGLKTLLNSYMDGQQFDCSGLVEAIIAQVGVDTI